MTEDDSKARQQNQGQENAEGRRSSSKRRRRRRGKRRSGAARGPLAPVEGFLLRKDQGDAVLVSRENNFVPSKTDPLVPAEMVDRLHLGSGLHLTAMAHSAGRPRVAEIQTIEGMTPEAYRDRAVPFSELISIDPEERFSLETEPHILEPRVTELIAPIGKGQRCLIVAPPKAGKTTLLQQIANAIAVNHPDVEISVLLVDERPEEVTHWKRSLTRGEVFASSSDQSIESHIRLTEMVLERSRRLVELGKDVVILMDSLTRMSRAYNNAQKGSGRILSGGIDARTMEKPRRFFGSARNVEHGGSLTIIATCLVDTGSRMDEVIFQEFKGTGNMEIVLDRKLFEKRVFPTINIPLSGTRKEEKLYPPELVEKLYLMRRALSALSPVEAMLLLLQKLKEFPTNERFLSSLNLR